MACAAITEVAECLLYLGRYEEAATGYEEGIRGAEKLGDRRLAAVGRGQLGTVRLLQKRYGEALESHWEALRIFESLGEPLTVAGFWHQIGRLHSVGGTSSRPGRRIDNLWRSVCNSRIAGAKLQA